MRLFAGLLLGPAAGALLGLVIVTLLNQNCDSFSAQLEGCRRYPVSGWVGLGALVGAGVGIVIGAVFQLLHERRRQPREPA